MSECKHGLRTGCSYCHVTSPPASWPRTTRPTTIRATRSRPTTTPRKRGSSSALSEKMNERMTQLKKRLREIRGDQPTK